MEKLGVKDFKSWPTAFTLARMVAAPFIYKSAKNNPRRAWKWGIFFAASDKVDGFLAKLEDTKEGSFIHKVTGWTGEDFRDHGFKRTEGGRQLDPFADYLFGGAILVASWQNGVMPRDLIKTEAVQKVSKGLLTGVATLMGVRLEVNDTGRHGEAGVATGNGLFYVAESIEDPVLKAGVRHVAEWLSIGGLALATQAESDYFNDFRAGLRQKQQDAS